MYQTRFSCSDYFEMIISYVSDTLYTEDEDFNAAQYFGAFASTYQISGNLSSVRSSKLLGYYNGKYYYQAVLSVYIKNFFCYTFNQYTVDMKYSKIDSEDK